MTKQTTEQAEPTPNPEDEPVSGRSANPIPPGVHGLSSEEVTERIAAGQVNVNTDLKTKSVRELVIENVCTIFNLINCVLAVLVIITGSWKNLTFLGLMFTNTAIGIVQALRSKKMVDELTLLSAKKAVAIRDDEEVELELDQLVLGDVVRLGRGDQIPADAVVVAGEAHVNEALLTGESDAIFKKPGSELMSGSFIDAGVLYARVTHVGADNYVARINNEAKYVKKVNSEIMNALNAIVRFASVLMVPLGIALFVSSVTEGNTAAVEEVGIWAYIFQGGAAWSDITAAILSTVAALLGMIPQGLVLLTSSVLALAVIRLARKKVLAQQLYCIETLARVDVLCLDKTGTITSGHMEVADTYALDGAGAVLPSKRAAKDAPAAIEEVEFALANIARATSDDANETCAAILARFGEGEEGGAPEPLRVVPFNSAKKWSGAAFERGAYVMGAAQFVLPPAAYRRVKDEVARLADRCRVLAVARCEGFSAQGDMLGAVELLGFVTIRDEIRASAPETIKYFCEQGVTLNVISGDDPRTVAGIARQVGVPGAERYVDATTLDTPAKLEAAAERYHVFGRVTPQQKRELVVALKKRGHTVAMTGDGVNDVLALKEADCSVAMAAGSDAARNVAELVLIDNDFSSMPAVVDEGRRSINNLQRSAALYLDKTLFSMLLAAICIFLPPYPFQPVSMSLINFFCIGMPSFVLALEPNHDRVKGSFLGNVLRRALPASLAVMVSSLLCIAVSRTMGYSDSELSMLCVITTTAIGCALIWRLSYPPTLLRRALFVVVIVGSAAGVLIFPDFFSISTPNAFQTGVLVVTSFVGIVLFNKLASLLDLVPDRPRRATGFGRGVQVSQGREGQTRVSATGTSFERFGRRVARSVQARRDQRALERAQADARRAVPGATRKSGVGLKSPAKAARDFRASREAAKAAEPVPGQGAPAAAPRPEAAGPRGQREQATVRTVKAARTRSAERPAAPARSDASSGPERREPGPARAAGEDRTRAPRTGTGAGSTASVTEGGAAAPKTTASEKRAAASGGASSAQRSAAPKAAPKPAKSTRGYTVQKSSDGIQVKMPAKRKGARP